MAFTIVYQDYQKNSCNYHSEEFNEINPNTAQAKKKEEYLRNLLDRISNYRFIAFTHYITDILQVISNLSLESQKENINYLCKFQHNKTKKHLNNSINNIVNY